MNRIFAAVSPVAGFVLFAMTPPDYYVYITNEPPPPEEWPAEAAALAR